MTSNTARLMAAALALFPAGFAAAQPASPAAAPAAPASTRLFSDSRLVQGERISVEVVGRGPDLVFIPGLASSRETWRATAERLRGRYRLHLVQVNGFAGEPARGNAAPGPVVVPVAEAIDAYLVSAKLSPATVIGHSLGGTIGLFLAEHHPEHLKKLMVVDALPFFGALMGGPGATPASVRPMAEAIRASAAKPPAPGASSGAFSQDAMIARMVTAPADKARVIGWGHASDPSVVGRAFADDIELDLSPGFGAIPTPVTLLYPDNVPTGAPAGVMDGVYGRAYAPVPHKTLTRIDNSMHFIMYDQPAAFATALDAFLAGSPVSRPELARPEIAR